MTSGVKQGRLSRIPGAHVAPDREPDQGDLCDDARFIIAR